MILIEYQNQPFILRLKQHNTSRGSFVELPPAQPNSYYTCGNRGLSILNKRTDDENVYVYCSKSRYLVVLIEERSPYLNLDKRPIRTHTRKQMFK